MRGLRFRSARGQQGQALVLSLFVVVLVLTATAIAVSTSLRALRGAEHSHQRLVLIALDDAGIAYALSRFALDRRFRGVDDLAVGDGTVSIEVAAAGAEAAVTVRSTYRRGRRVSQVRIDLDDLRGPRVVSWRPLPAGTTSGDQGAAERPVR